MDPERWQRIKAVLDTALELAPERREAYIAAMCGSDPSLEQEVRTLIASFEDAGDFMDRPPEPPTADMVTSDPMIGRRIGPYEIMEEIGHGGMGSVYRAVRSDDVFKKQVAIKVIRRGLNPEFLIARFRQERQMLAALDHPNVARILDGGATADGLPYYAMEFIFGEPIDQYCDKNRLTTVERLRLFRKVCAAVQAAHEKHIVHRDIKPSNILIDGHGEPKLLDFGIAKMHDPGIVGETAEPTATVHRLMTPEYASPEQVRGEAVTAGTDIYSLGVLLYELLTGRRPYRLASRAPHEIAQVICDVEPENPSTVVARPESVTRQAKTVVLTPAQVSEARRSAPDALRKSLSGDLDNIVLMAMRKEAARRYASAEQFSEDIELHLAGLPVRARRDSFTYRAGKFLQRHRAPIVAAAIALVIGTGTMQLWSRLLGTDARARPPVRILPLTTFAGDETQPAFSPDGRMVAFVWNGEDHENSDIYLKPVAGGELKRITTDPAEDVSPVYSPDGARIAFLRTKEDETAIFIAPVQGSGIHGKITTVYPTRIETVGRHLDWSPDGRYLAAADKGSPGDPFSIVLIDVTTGHKIRLTSPPMGIIGDSNPGFSPDGKQVAFIRALSSGVDDVHVVPVEGGDAHRLTHDRRYIIAQTWSADAKSIVFSSNRSGPPALWTIPIAGGTPERMPAIADSAADPAFSKDRKWLAYSQFYIDTNIWRMPVEGGKPRMLISSTQYDSSPEYSADGRSIAFRSSRSGSHEIWIADAEGRNARQLTRLSATLTGSPRWSPDNRWIAFDSRPDGQPDIFTMPSDGSSAPKRLTLEPGEDVVPSWSRDGRWIYFASNRGGSWQVWRTSPDGGAAQQMTRDGGFAPFESPDGKYLYYAKGRSEAGLWRMPLPNGPATLVLDKLKPGYWGYWAAAKDAIYYVDRIARQPAGLFRLDLTHNVTTRIGTFEKAPIPGDSALTLSPDGRYLLYAQVDQNGSDVILVENP